MSLSDQTEGDEVVSINKTLTFHRRKKKNVDECAICGKTHLGTDAVSANFISSDPPVYDAVYCFECIKRMNKVRKHAGR